MKKKFLLFIIMLFMFMVNVKAENKIYFETDNINIAPNSTKTVDILVDSESDFTKVSLDIITTSTYVNFHSIKFDDAFSKTTNNGLYVLTSNKPLKSGTKIGTITLKSSEAAENGATGYIKITKASLKSDKEIDLASSSLMFTISNEKSSNNNLDSITSDIIELEFDKDVTSYEVEVKNDVKELDLVAEAEDEKAEVKISNQKLKVGKNTITITVKAENEEEKVYEIKVNRKESKKAVKKDSSKKDKTETKKSDNKGMWTFTLIVFLMILIVDITYMKNKKTK